MNDTSYTTKTQVVVHPSIQTCEEGCCAKYGFELTIDGTDVGDQDNRGEYIGQQLHKSLLPSMVRKQTDTHHLHETVDLQAESQSFKVVAGIYMGAIGMENPEYRLLVSNQDLETQSGGTTGTRRRWEWSDATQADATTDVAWPTIIEEARDHVYNDMVWMLTATRPGFGNTNQQVMFGVSKIYLTTDDGQTEPSVVAFSDQLQGYCTLLSHRRLDLDDGSEIDLNVERDRLGAALTTYGRQLKPRFFPNDTRYVVIFPMINTEYPTSETRRSNSIRVWNQLAEETSNFSQPAQPTSVGHPVEISLRFS